MCKNINPLILALLFVGITSFTFESSAQRFRGAAVGGLNFSQIDGDNLAGYMKLGISAGFKLDYPIRDNADVSIDMLFDQRGSNGTLGFGSDATNRTLLNYLAVPIYATLKDWYIEDGDYHKASISAGLSVGYLFGVRSTTGSFFNNIDNFNKVDVSYLFSVNYRFNRRFGITLRHTRAFTKLVDDDGVSYFVTIRPEYYF